MINYILESSISLVLLLLVYMLLFRNDKMLVLKRFFLLISLVFSLTIPFIELDLIPINTGNESTFINQTYNTIVFIGDVTAKAGEQITLYENTTSSNFQSIYIFVILYLFGLSLFLFRFIKNLYKIILKAKKYACVRFQNATIVLLA